MPFMQNFRINGIFLLVLSEKSCIFAAANLRWGCLHIIGRGKQTY